MRDNKVMTIQDFSSFGQCSISVALPLISAMGCETVALPVAVLSTHTSEFKDYTFVDLSDNLLKSAEHIKGYNPDFDVIYTGYIGNSKALSEVQKILALFPSSKLVVDPAMAESGKLYDGIDGCYVNSMLELCRKSDLCLPNFSEACMLAGVECKDCPDENFTNSLCSKLFARGIKNYAITGVDSGDNISIIISRNGIISKIQTPKIQGKFYGAGDVFSSVVVGALANGLSVIDSIALATDFTGKAVAETSKDESHWYGLKFEKLLPSLIDALKNKLTEK